MPMYQFVTEDGYTHTIFMTMGAYDKKVKNGNLKLEDGRIGTQRVSLGRKNTGWPMESDAAGVDPTQIPEAGAELAAAGVSADFNPNTGAMIFESRGHRAQCLKAIGMHDRDAGFSDPTPN